MADSLSDDVNLLSDTGNDKVIDDVKADVKDDVLDDVDLLENDEEEEVLSDDEPEIEKEVVDEEEKPTPKKDLLPHERPTLTDIKKEFPDFFKKFPTMEHMLFREREYTQVFPTVQEAKDAAEATAALDDFRTDLFTGSGEKFTLALKEAGELEKFSRNFLTNLQKNDKDGYWNAITPTLENLVKGFMREGKRRNDANLIASAENLSIYLFDTDEIAKGTKTMIKDAPAEDKRVTDRLADIERRDYNNFRINVLEGIATGLDPVVGLDMKNLKPTMQKLIMKQIKDEIDEVIGKDTDHMKYVNTLWTKAKGNYTNEFKSKIISAYLERAKSLVPSIRRRVLADVLGMSPEKARQAKEQSESVQRRREPGSQGRPAGSSSARVHSAKNIDFNKTSDMDILNDNVTLKKGK